MKVDALAERRQVLPREPEIRGLGLEPVNFGGPSSEHQMAESPDVGADVDDDRTGHVVRHTVFIASDDVGEDHVVIGAGTHQKLRRHATILLESDPSRPMAYFSTLVFGFGVTVVSCAYW